MGKKIFIISGEESGDLHGASLIKALKERIPGLTVAGMGGERMRRAGLEGPDSREVSVVGLVEVAEKIPAIVRAFRTLKKRLAAGGFDCVVLIDFPEFNLRFARAARKLGVPVVYYISPQVWAWRRGRVKKIARLVDKMLVVFPFEPGIYREEGLDVEYVGHPLVDEARCALTTEEAREELGLSEDGAVVALLPGSRTGEVERMLPVMLSAARTIRKSLGEATFVLPAASGVEGLVKELAGEAGVDLRVVSNKMYEALRASDAAAVTSGTATLETALIGTPMVIAYRMSTISYLAGRMLIGVRHIGLPNIVAGKTVVRELIQKDATAGNISAELVALIKDGTKRRRIIEDFRRIRERLGDGGAATRAAGAIADFISNRTGAEAG